MSVTVASRAHRTIKGLPDYKDLTGTEELPIWVEEVSLRQGELPVGFYRNRPDTLEECILITNLGLHVHEEHGWVFVEYKDIESVETPDSKEHVMGLVVHRVGGGNLRVPVKGKRGKYRDAFQFLRFLNRIVIDQWDNE